MITIILVIYGKFYIRTETPYFCPTLNFKKSIIRYSTLHLSQEVESFLILYSNVSVGVNGII